MGKIGSLSAIVVLFFASFSFYFFNNAETPEDGSSIRECTVVDNDGSFDDLRSLIYLSCAEGLKPTHILFTEGVVKPEDGLANYAYLRERHRVSSELVLILGESSGKDLESEWKKIRQRDTDLNGLLQNKKRSKNHFLDLKGGINNIVASCDKINLLVLGPYLSSVSYWEAIAPKVQRVVTMGGEDLRFFNCWFDEASCHSFFNKVPSSIMNSVDIPFHDKVGRKYGFDQDFVDSLSGKEEVDLWHRIFVAGPAGWKPEKMLMWDDLTSIFFVQKGEFNRKGLYWQPSQEVTKYQTEWLSVIEGCSPP